MRTLAYDTQQSSHGHNRRGRTTCSPSLTRQSPSTPFSLLGTISEWPGRESHPHRHQQCFSLRDKSSSDEKDPTRARGVWRQTTNIMSTFHFKHHGPSNPRLESLIQPRNIRRTMILRGLTKKSHHVKMRWHQRSDRDRVLALT